MAPVLDAIFSGLEVARTGVALMAEEREYKEAPISRSADIGLGIGFMALFLSSAIYGFNTTAECREALDEKAQKEIDDQNLARIRQQARQTLEQRKQERVRQKALAEEQRKQQEKAAAAAAQATPEGAAKVQEPSGSPEGEEPKAEPPATSVPAPEPHVGARGSR